MKICDFCGKKADYLKEMIIAVSSNFDGTNSQDFKKLLCLNCIKRIKGEK